jgi:phosphatidate cytidylyltransferase
MMTVIFAFGFVLNRIGVVLLFGFVSFWALREFITMTPTRRGDHRTLFWVFFIFTPLQYILIGLGSDPPDFLGGNKGIDYYDFYSIMIPVYASLFIPARAAIAGDYKRFLERSAKIQSGLLICVYSLSYAPAILDLKLVQTDGTPWDGSTVSVLIFLVLIAQLASVFERAWGKLAGRHVIAEKINASRTWEGFLGSMVTTGMVAAALSWATPFHWWEAGMLGAVVTVMACAGTMTMSAIKRDRGVTDTGTLVQGHAGVLDQIDNICFAAPVFYHFTRFFWV